MEETARLDWLADPKNIFRYAVKADGRVEVQEPKQYCSANLREAVDFARALNGEIPFCPQCKIGVPAIQGYFSGKRWHCRKCKTTFNWVSTGMKRV